ncbi:MAG: glutamate formimidoyltransferase, partial [Thermoleophilia bacterium]|nr:glutamate formimidoyltransferase [Thermoleophilia bacterium]
MLESVPNVSEGRDRDAVAAIGAAAVDRGARLLDVHSDVDHHRSVLTLAAEPETIVEALLALARTALDVIDLRHHEGVHPRVGALDVVPIVPIGDADMAEASRVALAVAKRIGEELEVPVLLYGAVGEGRRPAFYRRGGLPELARRLESGELVPYAGPARLPPRSGAVLVGARAPLVAYNVELATADVRPAREIAAAVRESGGGLPGVQAIGLLLSSVGRAQVSMNVVDLDATPLHVVYREVERLAAERGIAVAGGELVGLVPERVLAEAEEAG